MKPDARWVMAMRPRSGRPGVLALLLAFASPFVHAGAEEASAGRDAPRSEEPRPPPKRPPAEPSHSLADDLRSLASPETALVLGVGGALALVAATKDAELTRSLTASSAADRVFEAGDVLGQGWLLGGSALATYAVGKIAGKPGVAHLGVDLIRAQALNGVLTFSLKFAVQRTRPDGGPYSFPSGHTSTSFATATVLGRRLGMKAGLPAFALATYVAVSRVQENQHFPSDVVFGAALGIASGRAVTAAHGRRAVTLVPLATPDGGLGLAVTAVW